MSENLRITLLVENSVQRQGLVAEHGLSFHIQIGERSLLFDTGQTDLALMNAEPLRLPLDRLQAIVLSHGHYDHTGGLPAILDAAPNAPVYLHPAAFEKKYSKSPNGKTRFMGMNPTTAQALHGRRNYVETTRCTQLGDGIFVTGEIPRVNPYEDTGGAFFLNADGTRPDPLTDDQALVIDLGCRVVLLLGCAHAGVINTLDHVQHLTGGKPVRAVIGGLHLGSASAERIEQTIARLRETNLECLAPIHCTGWPATAQLWQAFPDICRPAGVGTDFEFKRD
ncbi:MAG: MBL fold metallo-hydrolase [Verrucomicrobia subdivision 3 bacterium]|nr:MBL fold metallo-hydrolase [Verrucomicrobiota bacterium]MCC6821240.1 MBL fold metallo-hydrolase [Limisphaerales bacterium]